MNKGGPKKLKALNPIWSSDLAYGIGLITTDGCLLKDGRHIDFTSKDIEQLENFKKCFNLKTKISYKTSTYTGKKVSRIQFSNVRLYRFFLKIGLTPAKTKSLKSLDVPDKYYFDFLRGHHDGDGSFYSYWDPRWKSSFMYYLTFISASYNHINWIRKKNKKFLEVNGALSKEKGGSYYQLRYAKKESLKILKKMYHSKNVACLSRKHLKIEKALSIVNEKL